MNTTTYKLYHLNNLIGLNMLNLKFVHFKKLAKIQFLKNGKNDFTPLYVHLLFNILDMPCIPKLLGSVPRYFGIYLD